MGVIHIFSHGAEHTTARYFERVMRASGEASVYYSLHCPDPEKMMQGDMLLFIDPAPDWPIGIESSQCIKVAYFIDVHRDLQSRLQLSQFFDAIFIAQKDYVSVFKEAGHGHVYWLPLACDPEIHQAQTAQKVFEVGFVGKLDRPGTFRNKILTTVLPRYQTNDYSQYYFPRDMANVYGRSKIVLNVSINGDLNMRFFEAMAAGSLLVTDCIENGLNELFEDGVHYVGYSSLEEAIEKIDYYLINDTQRNRITVKGQQLVLEQHTYRHRWNDILQLSSPALGKALTQNYKNQELSALYSNIFVSLRMPWRIPAVIGRYGLSKAVVTALVKAWLRWLNAKITLTPNAIRRRFGS